MRVHVSICLVLLSAQFAWSANAPAKPAPKAAAKPDAKAEAPKKEAPKVEPTTVTTKEELLAAVKQLEADANTWMSGKGDHGKPVAYTETSIKFLSDALSGGSRKDPVDVYVAWKLLAALPEADANIIKKSLYAADSAADKLIKYQEFPQISADAKKRMTIPTDASIDDTARMKISIQKALADKIAKDKAVKLHNEACAKLESVVNHLRMKAADPRQDEELVTAAIKSESQGFTGWTDILALLDSRAGDLDEKRAKPLYSSLKNWANRVAYKKGKYQDVNGPAKIAGESPKTSNLDNSSYEVKDLYPGITIITLLNKLKDAAKEKDSLPVPTTQDIDAANKGTTPQPHKTTGKKK